MLRPGNEIILQILGKIYKISTIAGNAHNKILILLRLPLCCEQRFFIDDIELDMP